MDCSSNRCDVSLRFSFGAIRTMAVCSSESQELTESSKCMLILNFSHLQLFSREKYAVIFPEHYEAEKWRLELCVRAAAADAEHSV